MDIQTRHFTNRQFIAMVRAELAAEGRQDVTVERSWIDEDEPGYGFLLHVPIGTELSMPLRATDGFLQARDEEAKRRHAREFAKALVNLKSAEKALERYSARMRRAAKDQVAAVRAEGLDILVERVGFKPTYAYHLCGKSRRDLMDYAVAEVTVRHLSFHLQFTTSGLWAEEPADLALELGIIIEQQREHQAELAALEARGVDLEVDVLTLDLLAHHGIDEVEALRHLWKEQHAGFEVDCGGERCIISLNSSGGKAIASFQTPEAIWNGEHLWLRYDREDVGHVLVGKSLGELVPHPVFTSRPIIRNDNSRGTDQFVFDLSDKVMFDADTGRLWREERLAA